MKHIIGFIGGGNMAQAVIVGLLKSGRAAHEILVSDPNPDCRTTLKNMGIQAFQESESVMAKADFIVLAVKPQMMGTVLTTLTGLLRDSQVIISIAAGITINGIRHQLNEAQNPIVRVMPNTPALIGQGMSAMTSDSILNDSIKDAVQSIFESCGRALWVPSEEAIDAVTAVSGSGPAYFFLMIENLINSGIRLGLTPDVARELVIQTAKGAAGMVELSDVGPDVLRQRVTSPGGTTQAALEVFQEGDFADLLDRALIAARDRAGELSKDAS